MRLAWRNVILFSALHVGAVIGLYQLLSIAKWPTVFWSEQISIHLKKIGEGVGAGDNLFIY